MQNAYHSVLHTIAPECIETKSLHHPSPKKKNGSKVLTNLILMAKRAHERNEGSHNKIKSRCAYIAHIIRFTRTRGCEMKMKERIKKKKTQQQIHAYSMQKCDIKGRECEVIKNHKKTFGDEKLDKMLTKNRNRVHRVKSNENFNSFIFI